MEISEVIIYFIKVIAIQGVFFTLYWYVLRNRPNHSLNRVFLLSTLLLSLIIPLIENPIPERVEPILEVTMMEWITEPMGLMEPVTDNSYQHSGFSIWTTLSWLYLGLVVFFIGKSSFHLYLLQKIKKQCEYVKKRWFKLFKTTQSRPFSFFSSVFIPKEIFGSSSFDQILAHECVHVRLMHSLDRLLVDFLVSLFWFNPFIYLYRNALIEVHEYQADAEVIDKYNDLVGYQEILFSQLKPAAYSGLVSHFNFSTIKKRIVMMNKSKNASQSRLAYFLTLPVVVIVLFAFTTKESKESVVHISDKIEELTGPYNFKVEKLIQSDEYRPSILPIMAEAKFKVSSKFGLRKHPISGEMANHKGMDFATAIGTEIIATADGIVHETENMQDSYGKIVVILHGDKYMTRYAQLSEFKVKKGDKVKRGQVIALSGNSGRSTGPHLHYEVYEDSKLMNPQDYIKNYKFASFHKHDQSEHTSKPDLPHPPHSEDHVQPLNDLGLESEVEAEKMKMLAEEKMKMASVSQRTAQNEVKLAMAKENLAKAALDQSKVRAQLAEAKEQEEIRIVEKIQVEISEKKEKPLFILDGEVLYGKVENIDAESIESINVIKGEAAIEKYGEAGKNGVIEITSKGDMSLNKDKEIKVKVKNKRKNKTK